MGLITRVTSVCFLFMLVSCDATSRNGDFNGFDVDNTSVATEEILHGGPGRDGIPALDRPTFISADAALAELQDSDRVLGLVIDGEARAYPIKIMNWHEIVNDRVAGQPVLISYCPLCGTGMAFSAKIDDVTLSFGVSGLLFNSDVLMYDRESESLWSQIRATAISGPMRDRQLTQLPLQLTRWQDWRNRYPNTRVLSRQTGFWRDYDRDPYLGYEQSRQTFFPVSHPTPEGWHPKQWVTGISINGDTRAWPHAELDTLGKASFDEQVGGKQITVHYDPDNRVVRLTDKTQSTLPSITAFLFAWHTFHPDTRYFRNQ